MITLMYTDTIGSVYRHDTFCMSHLYSWEYFESECEFDGIPVTRDTLRYITLVPNIPDDPVKELGEYMSLVKDAFGDYLEKEGFAFNFHLDSPKLGVLFIAGFIRAIEEEGSWFIQRMVQSDGTLMERLWDVYHTTATWEWINPLHQVMLDTITRLPPDSTNYFSTEWDFWLTSLEQSPQTLLGADAFPEYEDSMDAFATKFMEVAKCLKC